MGAELKSDSRKNNRKLKKINHLLVILAITSFIIILFQNCDTTEPPQNYEPTTTSQNFTFETHEFGDGHESSYFNDVWIFDENNIWAVGYIGTDKVTNANIMRWNGKEWYIEKYQGHSSGIKGIWALDSSNIYFANGAVLLYRDGEYEQLNFGNLAFSNGQTVQKLWGSGASNIWGVGILGTLVHFDGVEWKKIDFDTQWNFTNIYGNTSAGFAYAVAHNRNFTSIIVKLEKDNQEIIYSREDNSAEPRATGIILFDDNYLYLSNSEIWKLNLQTNDYTIQNDLPSGYGLPSISGTSENDLYYFGSKYNEGERMIHFNGKRYYEHVFIANDFLLNRSSHAVKNLAVLVGFLNNKAFLIKIIRN